MPHVPVHGQRPSCFLFLTNCSSINKKSHHYRQLLCLFKKRPNNALIILKLFLLLFLGNDTEICHIAATDGKGNFNVYVMPNHGISAGASTINKLSVNNKGLVYNGPPVSTESLAEGVSKLLDWLKPRKPCIHLPHNGKSFDSKHLMKAWTTCGDLEEHSKMVMGFCDTLHVFRELLILTVSHVVRSPLLLTFWTLPILLIMHWLKCTCFKDWLQNLSAMIAS